MESRMGNLQDFLFLKTFYLDFKFVFSKIWVSTVLEKALNQVIFVCFVFLH